MSIIRPRPMPLKPERKPERNTPAWFSIKREQANERKALREQKRAEMQRDSHSQEKPHQRALRAGTGRLKRTRLKPRSVMKAKWHELYILGLRFLVSLNPFCRRCKERHATEGHHPARQHGAAILIFFPFCRVCHADVEGNKNRAREEGWIWY